MNAKMFSNALGNIDENYINEAVTYSGKRKKNTWVKWVSIAACLALIVAGGILGKALHSPDSGILSYFVITAYADTGELTELGMSDGCFNSGTKNGSMFDVDMPLFNFSVRPSNMKNNEAIYSEFDISISYNGTVVENFALDEHISVAYLIPTPDSDEPWSYSIMGWFTEPTDIIINIIDKESREIVETITVNVRYDADLQGYELEVVNVTTKFYEQEEAAEASNALMEYFNSQGYVHDYPEYFGGCYIEGNKLYVRLVSPTAEEMKSISKALARYDDVVVFKDAETAMADLQEYADRTADELMTLGYAVTSWYVDSITGNIVISVLEEDLAAVTDWIADIPTDENQPTIIIEKGAYVEAE